MIESKFIVYFLVGGCIIAIVTYLGATGKGWLAAFIAMFPTITVLTFYTVYLEAGSEATVSYIKGLMMFIPAWIVYLFWMLGAIPRLGIGPAILSGIAVYVTSAWLLSRLLL